MKVGFLSAGDENNQFWGEMVRFAQAVAEDLNIELIVKYPRQTTYTIRREGMKLLEELSGDSYLITSYVGAVTADLIAQTNLQGVKVFVINADIIKDERTRVGNPRGRNKGWLAHSFADDEQAGYILANELINQFELSSENPQQVRLVGITGPYTSQASFDRNKGLKKRISESDNAQLLEISSGEFEFASAKTVTEILLNKLPNLNTIWAASDNMGLGAISALKESRIKPGKDVIVGGIDWTRDALNAIQTGEMAATVGGHFMEAGMALILLYDYHHNLDFANDPGIEFTIPMYAITKDNVDEYMTNVGANPDWSKIDFKAFSKVHNKSLKKYDFSWQKVVAQMK